MEHWHPQLVKGEAAFWFSTTRQVALSTRVVRMLTLVNMVDFGFNCFDCLEDKNVLECLLIYGPYMWDGGENLDLLGFPSWYKWPDMQVMMCEGDREIDS